MNDVSILVGGLQDACTIDHRIPKPYTPTLQQLREGDASPQAVQLQPCTMRFESTAKVLAKCKLNYYRISECHGIGERRLSRGLGDKCSYRILVWGKDEVRNLHNMSAQGLPKGPICLEGLVKMPLAQALISCNGCRCTACREAAQYCASFCTMCDLLLWNHASQMAPISLGIALI